MLLEVGAFSGLKHLFFKNTICGLYVFTFPTFFYTASGLVVAGSGIPVISYLNTREFICNPLRFHVIYKSVTVYCSLSSHCTRAALSY